MSALLKSIQSKEFLGFYFLSLVHVALAVCVQFAIPKLLGVEEFGVFKRFTLYLSYTSLLHFGLKDGLFLWWCEPENRQDVKSQSPFFSAVVFQQLAVLAIGLIVILAIEGWSTSMLWLLSISTFFTIVNSAYEAWYFANKELLKPVFRKIIQIGTALVGVVGLSLVFKNLSALNVIAIYTASHILVGLIYFAFGDLLLTGLRSLRAIKLDLAAIRVRGLKIQTGNFLHQLSLNGDKLLVATLYSDHMFGLYSFGAMFVMLCNMLIAGLSNFILPRLFDGDESSVGYDVMMSGVFLLTPGVVLLFFFVDWFIPSWYQDFIPSIDIVAGLLLAIFLNVPTSLIQNNFLKRFQLEGWFASINLAGFALMATTIFLLAICDVPVVFVSIVVSLTFLFRYLLFDVILMRRLEHSKSWSRRHLVLVATVACWVWFICGTVPKMA